MRDEKGRFIKGHSSSNTGRTVFKKGVQIRLGAKHSEESKRKMSIAKIGKMPTNLEDLRSGKFALRGTAHPNWKGEKASYSSIHKWVYKVIKKANKCLRCASTKNIEYANISRKYLRDVNDWAQLCSKCHKEFDKRNISLAELLGK